MPVILYRRHTSRCPTKDPDRKESKLSHKAKRLYLGCDCPLWVAGRIDGHPIERQSCRTADQVEARCMIAALGSAIPEPVKEETGPRLAECITQYLEHRENEIRDETRFYYKLVLGWLLDFAQKNQVVLIRDLSVELLERFKFEGLPKLKDSTRGVYTAKLRAFLREAERLGWIEARLADRVRPHRHEHEQTQPFTEAELGKILKAATGPYRCLIELMLETGMRVSDALQFEPARLVKGEHLWIYPFRMTKRKRLAPARASRFEAFLSDQLKTAIDRTEWASETLPFSSPTIRRGNYARVYREMQRIGKECGIAECRPHRLRDSFAVRKLLAGVSLDDVSRLLGHASVSMTEQAYAAWIPARARRLEGIVAASLHPTRHHS